MESNPVKQSAVKRGQVTVLSLQPELSGFAQTPPVSLPRIRNSRTGFGSAASPNEVSGSKHTVRGK
jgi:hypothetical protein